MYFFGSQNVITNHFGLFTHGRNTISKLWNLWNLYCMRVTTRINSFEADWNAEDPRWCVASGFDWRQKSNPKPFGGSQCWMQRTESVLKLTYCIVPRSHWSCPFDLNAAFVFSDNMEDIQTLFISMMWKMHLCYDYCVAASYTALCNIAPNLLRHLVSQCHSLLTSSTEETWGDALALFFRPR